MSAALVLIAQAATPQVAVKPNLVAVPSTSISQQARASVRILRPVTLRTEEGRTGPRQGFVPPQRSAGENGQVWFEFS